VIVAGLSPLLFGERLTRRLVLSAALAITGTVLLVSPIDLTALRGAAGTGLLLALGSALGYALVAIVSRSVARHAHPLTPVTVGFAVGALVLLPALLFDGPRLDFPPVGWLLLVYLAVVPSALAYVLFTVGMRTTLATVASLVTLIEPLTAAGLAWLLFDERLGPLALVGAGLLLGAVWLLARE
jgi:DME family drug/metabolite transporter